MAQIIQQGFHNRKAGNVRVLADTDRENAVRGSIDLANHLLAQGCTIMGSPNEYAVKHEDGTPCCVISIEPSATQRREIDRIFLSKVWAAMTEKCGYRVRPSSRSDILRSDAKT